MNAAEPVFVSEVIGEGAEAHRLVRVASWEFRAPGVAGTEPEIPDTALAQRLEVEVRRLRELSERHERAGNIAPRVCRTIRQTGGRPGLARFYSEADALFIITKSGSPKAVALTKEMIRVYMAARRGLLVPAGHVPAEEAESLRRELAEIRANSLAGVLGPKRAETDILAPIAKAAVLHPKGKRAGLRWLNNKLRNAVGHNGEKSAWRLLPAVDLADAQRALEKAVDELADAQRALEKAVDELGRLRAATEEARQLTFVFVLNPKPRRGN